jgi:hypothetical protein
VLAHFVAGRFDAAEVVDDSKPAYTPEQMDAMLTLVQPGTTRCWRRAAGVTGRLKRW